MIFIVIVKNLHLKTTEKKLVISSVRQLVKIKLKKLTLGD